MLVARSNFVLFIAFFNTDIGSELAVDKTGTWNIPEHSGTSRNTEKKINKNKGKMKKKSVYIYINEITFYPKKNSYKKKYGVGGTVV